MELVNAYLSGSDIVLLSRDEEGKLVQKKTRPEHIVYVDAAECGEEFARQISKSRFCKSFKREGRWIRIGWADRLIRDEMLYGRRASQGMEARPSPFEERGIQTYEGDVHPVRRFMTDNAVKIQKPRRAYFDIETDSRVPFSRKEQARILSWAIMAEDGRKWSMVLEENDNQAERDLLTKFFQTIDEFDQMLAWSSRTGDTFDFAMLRARIDYHMMRVDMDRWLWLDQLMLFMKMNTAAESGEEKTSMKLKDVSMALLGEGKDDFDSSKTWPAWENKTPCDSGKCMACRACLLRYNEKDTELLHKIEVKTGSAKLFDCAAEVCNIFPDTRGLSPTVQMDGYMLREGLERGIHFVTKRFREVDGEKYAGAYVMEPKAKGIERNVHVCDFASLYPSIILTWNMSPETKIDIPINGPVPEGTCRAPSTGQGFRTDEIGILPNALKKLLDLRKEWKKKKADCPPGTTGFYDADRRSTAHKVIANSFYGVLGTPYSRFFDVRIAMSITKNGEWLLKRTIEEADKRGMESIYADTDSVFVKNASRTQFEDFVKWCNEELYPQIIAKQGCVDNFIKLGYEKQFERVVFTGKKRYAGRYAHFDGKEATADSKPEIKGLEYRRGDTAFLARRLQEAVVNRMIVEGDDRPEPFHAMLKDLRTKILNDALTVEEVSLAKGLSKPLKEYIAKKKKDNTDSALPPHVRVARVLASRGEEVSEGMKIAYVVLDGDGGINAPIPACDYDGTCDRYYLWENLIYPPTHRLLEAAFPDRDWKTGFEKIRPPKLRSKGKAPLKGQLALGLVQEAKDDFVLSISEKYVCTDFFKIIGELASKHPGGRDLVVHILLRSGSTAVSSLAGVKVSGSALFLADVERVLWEHARHMEWEAQCAS